MTYHHEHQRENHLSYAGADDTRPTPQNIVDARTSTRTIIAMMAVVITCIGFVCLI